MHLRLPEPADATFRPERRLRLRSAMPVRHDVRMPAIATSTGGILLPGSRQWHSLCSKRITMEKYAMPRLTLLSAVFAGFLSLTACVSPPSGLNLALDRPTTAEKYRVALHPPAGPIPLNKIHAWEIQLLTPSGETVPGARFRVGGGMPQHGHGFPTQPRVTKDLGNGRYLLEGMKFSMPGWWEIKLAIDAPAGTDEVSFNKIIASGVASTSASTSASASAPATADTAQR
jgi:hypothetical protein